MQELTGGFHLAYPQRPAQSAGGDFLAGFRERHGLTQEELGRVVARSRTTVSSWENGAPPDLAAQRLLMSIDGNPGLVRGLARSTVEVEDPAAKVRDFLLSANVGVDASPVGDPAAGRYFVTKRNARMEAPLHVLRAMATQPGDAGGYLVGEATREPVQAPLLPTRLAALGVAYEALPRPELDQLVPVALDLPVAQWLAETDPVSESTPAIARHGAHLRWCGCGVSYSRALTTLTGERVARLVASQVRLSLARALDGAVLAGDGLLQPLGLLGQVPELAVAGIDATAILDAIEDLEEAGVDSARLGIVGGSMVKRSLAAIPHGGEFLWRTRNGAQSVAGIPAMVAAAMPDNELLVGDFSTVVAHHSADVTLVQIATGADDRRQTFAFLTVALSVPSPAAFVRITVNA